MDEDMGLDLDLDLDLDLGVFRRVMMRWKAMLLLMGGDERWTAGDVTLGNPGILEP